MAVRASSKVYNSNALEVWFRNVGLDWEAYFPEEVLHRGRRLYREGKISGLELAESDAIVHCTFEHRNTCYAVIEWSREGPSLRFSTEDEALGKAVAAGGLYEIEELIADEIPPLPKEPTGDEAVAGGGAQEAEATGPEPVEAACTRRLTPRLEGLRSGLRLTAYFTNEDFSTRPAFGEGAATLAAPERERLVRLTGLAYGAGFRFRPEAGDFLLDDPTRIGPFLARNLHKWEELFEYVDLDADAGRMTEGVRDVKLAGRMRAAGADRLTVDWRFKVGEDWLDTGVSERLGRSGRGTHIVKGLGLVRIGDEASEVLNDWRVSFHDAARPEPVTWPRYMIFSIFGERGASLSLEPQLRDWRETLLRAEGAAQEPSGPLPTELRGYQEAGVRWMAKLRALGCHGLLADEMGLGKTVQVLSLLRCFPAESGLPSLVVCPASVVPVWRSEAERWFPGMQTAVLHSGRNFSGPEGGTVQLWIASYTQLRRHKHLLQAVRFSHAVLDEAQMIKNPDAKVTQACFAIQADCRFALTGTPIENRLLDMWTLFRFLMPGLLGSRKRFVEACEQAQAEQREAFEGRLRKQISPFVLRRRKEAVGRDLPPKVEMDLICPISPLQQRAYEGLLARGHAEFEGGLERALEERPMHLFALLTRLRQVCCDPGLLPDMSADPEQSGKVALLLTRLSEVLAGDGTGSGKVVIFSQFAKLLRRLRPLLRRRFKVEVTELTGATKDRAAVVAAFQEAEAPRILLVSLRAGGTGITLSAADYVFLMDPWWNPAVENQAVDRVHRIGQKRSVFVYRMVTRGTIEERIQRLKREKAVLFERTLTDLGGTQALRGQFKDLEALAALARSE